MDCKVLPCTYDETKGEYRYEMIYMSEAKAAKQGRAIKTIQARRKK